MICWKIRVEESSKDETFGRKRVEILVDRFGSPDFNRGMGRGYSSSHCGVDDVRVVWYGKWKGGLAKCVDKRLAKGWLVDGRFGMRCLGGVVKTK